MTSWILTQSPTRNFQVMAWFSRRVDRSISFQRVFAGVVMPVDLDHVVFPLDPAGGVAWSCGVARRDRRRVVILECGACSWSPRVRVGLSSTSGRHQLHSALRAAARCSLDLGMHRQA